MPKVQEGKNNMLQSTTTLVETAMVASSTSTTGKTAFEYETNKNGVK